jgi:hypothetical protein
VALSITPAYLKQVGLMNSEPDPAQDIGPLLYTALQKVAFLPFAYMVDKWRWEVYAGKVKPADYDKAWWALREQYQGVSVRPAMVEAASTPAPSTTSPATPRTRATSWPTCCSSSSTARCAAKPATPAR